MLKTSQYLRNSDLKVLVRNLATCSTQHSSNRNYVHPNPLNQPIPAANKFKSKHANPKYRIERARKVVKVDLPKFHEKKDEDLTPEEVRTKMKELGLQPNRPWTEKPIFIASTGTSIDPYVPPEGDGKASIVSTEGAKQKLEFAGKKGKSMMAVRKIRDYDEEFEYKDFVQEAQKIYINLHEALVKYDETELHKLATERAFPLVINQAKNKTLRWAFHGSIEPPRVVHVRYLDMITKDNLFAQITVRFHTQQTLAVYDRFGRLFHGSESVLKDVLEYIVFEKHITNEYGIWRIHDKIIPEWMNLSPTSFCTFKVPEEEPPSDKDTDVTDKKTTEVDDKKPTDVDANAPNVQFA